MTATVLMVPVVLLATLLVVQFALAYYARTVMSGAAQDGAAAAARRNASVSEGISLTDSLLSNAAGSLLNDYSVTASTSDDTVTVRAEGEVVSLLPFFGTITVAATGSAHLEQFDAQGAGP